MRDPGRGASSGRGATRVGRSNVFAALRSVPVSVSLARTRVGEKSRHSRTSSRSASRSRFSISRHSSSVRGVEGGRDVHVGNPVVAREVGTQARRPDRVGLRLDRQIEDASAGVLERPRVGVVDALAQDGGLVRDEGGDHVDDLGQAAHPHALGLPQQRVEEAAHQQGVLEVVDLLQEPGGELPLAVGEAAAPRAVPDVPFVEGEPQALGRLQHPLHVVAHGRDLLDLPFHVEVHGEVAGGVVAGELGRVAVVVVQRDGRPPGRSTPRGPRDPRSR